MEKILIGINGPPGIGKSWLGNQITSFLLKRFPSATIAQFAIRDVIWAEFKEQHGFYGDYETFKSTAFNGFTGRQRLIDFTEGKRAEDLHYFDRKYIADPRFESSDIVIHDSLRKPEEQDWFLSKVPNFMTIVIAPILQFTWSQYEGDSGICLPPHGGFRASDSSAALKEFKSLVDNATLNADSIWFKLHLARSVDVKRD